VEKGPGWPFPYGYISRIEDDGGLPVEGGVMQALDLDRDRVRTTPQSADEQLVLPLLGGIVQIVGAKEYARPCTHPACHSLYHGQ